MVAISHTAAILGYLHNESTLKGGKPNYNQTHINYCVLRYLLQTTSRLDDHWIIKRSITSFETSLYSEHLEKFVYTFISVFGGPFVVYIDNNLCCFSDHISYFHMTSMDVLSVACILSKSSTHIIT